MSTIGYDCEIIIDGSGYFVQPGSYIMHKPRIRKATVRADGGESYVDLGPGKREWSMMIICMNNLMNYDGSANSNDGQAFRASLLTSYNKVAQTVNFVDPSNSTIAVHFDDYKEHVGDIHSQVIEVATGTSPPHLSYLIQIVLVEA